MSETYAPDDKRRHLIPMGGKDDPRAEELRARAQEARKARKYRYVDDVVHAEDLLSKSLTDAANAAIAIVKGEARAYLINHKTGEVNEVPVDPATRLKAAEFIFKRIAGEPERQTTMELGEGAAGVFRVLLGGAAQDHWDTSLSSREFDSMAAPVEASFAALPASAEGDDLGEH